VPFCSWTADDKVLIMENLKDLGWRDALNKKNGLDIDHIRAAVKWMANFHAVGYAFLDGYSGGLDQASADMPIFFFAYKDLFDWDKEVLQFQDVGNNQQKSLFQGLEDKYPGKDFLQHWEKLIESHGDLTTAAMKVRDIQKYKLKTICHGDPWFNNMMFTYKENGKVDDILYIDFQMVCYASPVLDMSYFLSASTTGDVRSRYIQHILTLYHTTFMTTLEKLGIHVDFSFEDLEEDYNKARLHGLNFALGALPSILAEKKDDIIDTEEWTQAMNIEDEDVKKKKITEIMERLSANLNASDAMTTRIRDLMEEWIDGGDTLKGL